MALTLDVWEIPAERASRVGHPAPFPVELPEQLIRLYTFRDDLVLDPFMGSGSALVAAARLGRRYVGYDTDAAYVEIARQRVAEVLAGPEPVLVDTRPLDDGKGAQKLAEHALAQAGFAITRRNQRIPRTGVSVTFAAIDMAGDTWFFDVVGTRTSHRGGLRRIDAVWKALGRAHAVRGRGAGDGTPLVLLTTDLPPRPSEGDTALRAAGPAAFFDAIDVQSEDGLARLLRYAGGGCTTAPEPGFWTAADLT